MHKHISNVGKRMMRMMHLLTQAGTIKYALQLTLNSHSAARGFSCTRLEVLVSSPVPNHLFAAMQILIGDIR